MAYLSKLMTMFARWGIPEELVSDCGTQFTANEFKELGEKYGFKHYMSSPHHHQANGSAESAVRIAKRILKQEDVFWALMAWRRHLSRLQESHHPS